MKKRILSMLLLLCLVVTAVPVFVLPTAAAVATENEVTVTVEFRNTNGFTNSNPGTVVASRTYTTVNGLLTSTIELPTEAECTAKSLVAANILGWYAPTLNLESYITPEAYVGNYLFTKDTTLVFYPYSKSSTIGISQIESISTTAKNLPLYTGSGGNNITAYRDGWQIGYFTSGKFTPYTRMTTTPMLRAESKDSWTGGGCYFSDKNLGLILAKTSSSYVSALAWTALADGTVDLDFSDFAITANSSYPCTANSGIYIVVTKNDQIIWPAEAVETGTTVVTSGFAAKNWKYYSYGNTENKTSHFTVTFADAVIENLSVEAGDTISFVYGTTESRIIVDPTPSVSYTEVGEERVEIITSLTEEWENVITSRPFDEGNAPTYTTETDILYPPTTATVNRLNMVYPGAWDFIVYSSVSAVNGKPSVAGTTSVADDYITIKDYDDTAVGNANAGRVPAFFISPLHDNPSYWGAAYSIGVRSGNVAGYRYTATETGLASFSFDAFSNTSSKTNDPVTAHLQKVRLAIYVDGVKVFPAESGWFTPYAEGDTVGTDVSARINEQLKDLTTYVKKGSTVEFLLYMENNTSIYSGRGHSMTPVVTVKDFTADFSATASLSGTLALGVSAAENAQSFAPRQNYAYPIPGTVAVVIDTGDLDLTVSQNGASATVSGFAAKQMTDEVAYTITADVKKTDGTIDEDVIIEEGTVTLADYLKSLLAADISQEYNDLALATLNYGAAAQNYFGYNTDNLANAGVTGELSFTLEEAKSELAFAGSGAYKFSGATLLLEDTVVLKLMADAVDAPLADYAGLYVKAADSDVKIPLLPREGDKDGSHLKALVEIPFSKLSTAFTFAVYNANGEQVSHSLTYSVDTYAARTANFTEQADLVAAMRKAGVASFNYVDKYTVNNLTSIIDVDYRTGSAEDANGHTLATQIITNGSAPVLSANGASFNSESGFSYRLTADDYNAMKNSLTIETVVTVRKPGEGQSYYHNWNYVGIISNQNGGGFGIEYWYNNNNDRLQFNIVPSVTTTTTNEETGDEVMTTKAGTTVSVQAPITTGVQMHLVATYDGENLSIYIDGELVAQTACTSDIFHTLTNGGYYLFAGADTANWGTIQVPSFCDIAYFNLYAEGVTAEQVAAMYAAAQA